MGQKPALQAFTVDLEDWYQGIELPFDQWKNYAPRTEKGLYSLLDLMDKYHVKGTFFTLGWIAAQYPNIIREPSKRGHEFGSHGFSHEKVYHLTPDQFRQEIKDTKRLIEDLTGKPVTSHRSPFFTITAKCLWALPILAEEGYKIDCSISPVKTWRYGIANCPDDIFRVSDANIIEFPVSTFRFLRKRWAIGGAYFRILPYSFTRNGIRKRQSAGKASMFYIHPWEFDPGHPRAPMEWKAKLTHYSRLHKTYSFTEKMLRDFKFNTVSRTVEYYAQSKPLQEVTTQLLRD